LFGSCTRATTEMGWLWTCINGPSARGEKNWWSCRSRSIDASPIFQYRRRPTPSSRRRRQPSSFSVTV
jgi:hypothetical protein